MTIISLQLKIIQNTLNIKNQLLEIVSLFSKNVTTVPLVRRAKEGRKMVEGSIFPINNLSFFITGLLFHNYGPDYGRDYGVTTQLLNAIAANFNLET